MFSSNQILQVSGDLRHSDSLYNALEFALKVSDNLNSFKNGSKCVYQITKDGRYCIGWAYQDIPEGWTQYPFDFSLSIISQIIEQHLEKQEIEYDMWDGSYDKGFIMEIISESLASEKDGIKSPFYGIVSFRPYTCFYSK